jgi:hypothetical protein
LNLIADLFFLKEILYTFPGLINNEADSKKSKREELDLQPKTYLYQSSISLAVQKKYISLCWKVGS